MTAEAGEREGDLWKIMSVLCQAGVGHFLCGFEDQKPGGSTLMPYQFSV